MFSCKLANVLLFLSQAHTNKKAWFRLMTAAEKTKKVLSSNPNAPIAIECFMDDIDVKGMMARDLFLELCEPLMDKLAKVQI